MQNVINSFEAELLHKIQFKASSKVSADTFLFKAFRFFDLLNVGYLTRNDFFKAIAKCGVVVDTHDIQTVYQAYASEDGNVHYQDFIQRLLFREEKPISPVDNSRQLRQSNLLHKQPQETQKKEVHPHQRLAESKIDKLFSKCESYAQVLDFIAKHSQSDKIGGLLSQAVKLKSADTKRTHHLNRSSLSSVFPFLDQQHLNLIFSELSQNGKQIDYSVLVYDLKGQLDEERLSQFQQLFQMLDLKKEGEFTINYLLAKYLSKRESQSFSTAVQLYSKFQGIDDGVFTFQDFIDFMGFLSFDCLEMDTFQRLLVKPFYQEDTQSIASHKSHRSRDFNNNNANRKQQKQHSQIEGNFRKSKEQPLEQTNFNKQNQQQIDNGDKKSVISRYSQLKQVPSNQIKQVQSIILRIKRRLASKGTKGFLYFQKALKAADFDRDGLLSYQQFTSVIKDQRIDITPTESDLIFKIFDEQGLNLVSFNEVMFSLRGHMPENRKIFSDQLWNKIKNTDQLSNFGQLKKRLNFRSHPDVQNGRKYQEDIWKQIQQTILTIQQLNGTTRKDTITKAEFEQYLQNLSLSINDDKLFETMLYHFWRLQTSADIKEQYAGSRKLFDPSKKSYLMDHHRHVLHGGSVSQSAPFGTSIEPTNYITQHKKL